AVAPSIQTVMDGTYQPLARPIFIYVNSAAAKRKEIRAFVEFYLKNATPLVEEVGYIPLNAADYEKHLQRFQAFK
ncbi:MAG: protein sphX, partial [Candidatus Omnitrophota bacterium]|nr:protein sphX [Candidatus Omnitrophota bacterium]